MTQFLPPNLLALFAARDPVPYLPPPDKLPHEKKNVHNYSGLVPFLRGLFEDPAETPPPTRVETRDERKDRKKRDKDERTAYKLEQEIAMWDPTTMEESTTDPFKTLFVARINFYTSESKLKREFESYGPIKSIKMIKDESGKPKGYCFIEYEHERDMHSAYKHGDGKKIDGRRVLVDVERGRTVKGWLPRRLGGGLGGTRRGGPDLNVRHSGREDGGGGGGGGGRDRDRDEDGGAARRRNRSRDRERERDRDRRRRRSRSRDNRKRPKSRSRSRERPERAKRSRSRDMSSRKQRSSRRSSRSRSRDRPSRRDKGDRRAAAARGGGSLQTEDGGAAGAADQEAGDFKWNIVKEEPDDEMYSQEYGGGSGNMYGGEETRVKEEDLDEVDEKPQHHHHQHHYAADNGYYDDNNSGNY